MILLLHSDADWAREGAAFPPRPAPAPIVLALLLLLQIQILFYISSLYSSKINFSLFSECFEVYWSDFPFPPLVFLSVSFLSLLFLSSLPLLLPPLLLPLFQATSRKTLRLQALSRCSPTAWRCRSPLRLSASRYLPSTSSHFLLFPSFSFESFSHISNLEIK